MLSLRIALLVAACCFAVFQGEALVADDTPPQPRPADQQAADYETEVKPFFARYCLSCHSGDKAKGGLQFDKYTTEADVRKYRAVAERVRVVLDAGTMPPEDPQPEDSERTRVLNWLETRVLKVDCSKGVDPGRVTIRRLNRTEYNNTIRDLLSTDIRAADDFPSDDVGYGFDNIGDVLSLPPVLFEKYLIAAERISDYVIRTPEGDREPLKTENGRTLASNSQIPLEFEVQTAGEYRLRSRAWAQQAGDENAKMELKLDDRTIDTVEVVAEDGKGANHDLVLKLDPGKHTFVAAFINDYYNPEAKNKRRRDRNLIIESLSVTGPMNLLPENLPESHRKLISCRPDQPSQVTDCCRQILKPLVTRAFRRPAEEEEIRRLTSLVDNAVRAGDSFERGIQLALQAVLVSPEFLFRFEFDTETANANPNAIRTINDWELATRLSYFLWSSLPDDELFRLAAAGTLRKEGNLATQVKRMLQDPRSHQLVENFSTQWLNLRLLKQINPDRKRFPTFDDDLRADMETETKLFFESVMREDRPILDLLDAQYTFLNERLAKHYGVPDVTGNEFRRVTLNGPQRGGLLGQASILTVTSNPTRTSPVKRGKWVLENLFNAPPPPPPPGVPELSEAKDKVLSGSLRQRMEQHRANPACAVCHNQMDALGFGLENYDPIGAWREKDGEFSIDASGTLPAGESFQSPAELRAILKNRHADFRRCLTEKLLTYALGRGLEYYDECAVNGIVRNAAANRDTFSALVLEIVSSDPFQKRRVKRGDEP